MGGGIAIDAMQVRVAWGWRYGIERCSDGAVAVGDILVNMVVSEYVGGIWRYCRSMGPSQRLHLSKGMLKACEAWKSLCI